MKRRWSLMQEPSEMEAEMNEARLSMGIRIPAVNRYPLYYLHEDIVSV
jgi:hypothetical protein